MQQDTRLTQKSQQPSCTQMIKWLRKKIRETSPFTIATNCIKYLRVTLTEQVEDLYDKNFKSLKKEIEEDTRRQNNLPCSLVSRINIVKIAILPKVIYRFNAMPIKISANFSQTLKEQYLMSHGKAKTQDSQNNPV